MAKQCLIITVFNQKGGVGKTTSACNLACAFGYRNYKVLVVDMDGQGTATAWLTNHGGVNYPGKVVKCSRTTEELRALIKQTSDSGEFDIVLIDCVPSLESPMNWAALQISDLILMPTKLEAQDIAAIPSAIEAVSRAQVAAERDIPVRILPVAYKPNDSQQQVAFNMLRNGVINKFPITQAYFGALVAFMRGMGQGASAYNMTRSADAVAQLERVTDELCTILRIPKKLEEQAAQA